MLDSVLPKKRLELLHAHLSDIFLASAGLREAQQRIQMCEEVKNKAVE